MSKKMVESFLKTEDHQYHHPDILKAFRKLEEDRRIKISFGKHGRGRVQYYYMITDEGLKLLISDEPSPYKFWRALVGFCYHSDKQINSDEFEEFYRVFINKYLKYSSVHGYSFQLDDFNNVCINWFNKTILSSENISLDQKLLEILAFSEDPITIEGLSKEIESSIDDTKNILSKYTQIPHKPLEIPGDVHNLDEVLKCSVSWQDIMLHYSIGIKNDARGNNLYELSLFGIILVLTLIRYNDMNRLKRGLYYNNISFQGYFDKIASNYKNKLPLIFGKWYLLKRILKEYSAYNFDVILDKETRLKSTSESILSRGKREFYESSKLIVQYNRKQLGEVQDKGVEFYSNFRFTDKSFYVPIDDREKNSEKQDYQKLEAIKLKIFEIGTLLEPFSYDPASYIKLLENTIGLDEARRLSRLHEIDIICESLAKEITSIYYVNLYDEYGFQVMQPMNYFSSIMDKAETEYLSTLGKRQMLNYKGEEFDSYSIMPGSMKLPPKRRLLSILKDENIREWFSKWISDLMNYQNELVNKIFTFSEDIEALKNI